MFGRRRRRRPAPAVVPPPGMDPVLLEIFDNGLAALRGDRAERMAEAMRRESAARTTAGSAGAGGGSPGWCR